MLAHTHTHTCTCVYVSIHIYMCIYIERTDTYQQTNECMYLDIHNICTYISLHIYIYYTFLHGERERVREGERQIEKEAGRERKGDQESYRDRCACMYLWNVTVIHTCKYIYIYIRIHISYIYIYPCIHIYTYMYIYIYNIYVRLACPV